MSVLYPLIQALVLFAVAPLLSGVTRVARARLHMAFSDDVFSASASRASSSPWTMCWTRCALCFARKVPVKST